MQRRVVPVGIVICVVVLSGVFIGGSDPVAADSEYDITIPGSIETPTREVAVYGSTYEISAIGRAESGDSVDVEVTAPDSDQEYEVYLYNSDQNVVERTRLEGDDTATFDLSDLDLDAGTYVFTVQEQGSTETIHPFVIKGYDISVTSPKSATVGAEIEVDVSLYQIDQSATNNRVEVVVAGEDQDTTATASENGSRYTATIDTDSLAAGSYRVYANVRGEKEVLGEKVMFGISDPQSLDLESGSTSESTSESGGGGGGGGGALPPGTTEGTETVTATQTPANQTATSTVNTTTSNQSTSENSRDQVTDNTDSSSGTTGSLGSTTPKRTDTTPTPMNVVTPNEQSPTTETNTPGFDLTLLGVLFVVAILLARGRH
ncbi:hypothetical protein [Halobellus sp. GM3]|uniref:hypothetical protein n=1 Tax=Halobellus sp. GM3 TaxID=3458410 RepID=UPI00403E1DD7